MISGLIAHVSQCLCASYKKTAAQTALISNDPVAAAILTNHENLWRLARGLIFWLKARVAISRIDALLQVALEMAIVAVKKREGKELK